jgi:hypothetical protein
MVILGHIILKRKHFVTDNAAAIPHDHFPGIVFSIEKFLSVRGIATIILGVPLVIMNRFKMRSGIDSDNFF